MKCLLYILTFIILLVGCSKDDDFHAFSMDNNSPAYIQLFDWDVSMEYVKNSAQNTYTHTGGGVSYDNSGNINERWIHFSMPNELDGFITYYFNANDQLYIIRYLTAEDLSTYDDWYNYFTSKIGQCNKTSSEYFWMASNMTIKMALKDVGKSLTTIYIEFYKP